jgi:hypothetical protein
VRNNHGRIQGRAGVKLRGRRLAQEPLCRHCAERGIVKEAVTPDHITPLSSGGTDTDDNIQCLCHECHLIKTAGEANQYAASNHPTWLGPSAIPLTIVCGPPASGKTTLVKDRADSTDAVICLDSIMAHINPRYQHWQRDLNRADFNHAIRARNAMLAQLSRATSGKAWFIISAPTEGERAWWQGKLGGDVILLDPGLEECKRRASNRGTPRALSGIDKWYRSSRMPWTAPEEKPTAPTFGEDGWPIS